MRLRACWVLPLLLVGVRVLPTWAQEPIIRTGEFRGHPWGSTLEQVAAGEEARLIRQDAVLAVYRDSFLDLPANVIYLFDRGRLVMGFYQILVESEDLEQFFSEYHRLKYYLIGDLGQPTAENWQHAAKDIQEDREAWAAALGFGLLKVETGWLLQDTQVALRLSGGNFTAHLLVACLDASGLAEGRQAYRKYFARKLGVPNPYFMQ